MAPDDCLPAQALVSVCVFLCRFNDTLALSLMSFCCSACFHASQRPPTIRANTRRQTRTRVEGGTWRQRRQEALLRHGRAPV